MSPSTPTQNEKNELPLDRLKIRIGFLKFLATLFFGTVLTSLLTWIISLREIEIKERESSLQLQLNERKELANYFRYTMEGDVYDRLKLSNFFGEVLTDKQARALWKDYYNTQDSLLKEFLDTSVKIQEVKITLESNINEENKNKLKQDLVKYEFYYRKLERLLKPINIEIQNDNIQKKETKILLKAVSLNVPYFSQRKNKVERYTSGGATSLAMVLAYYKVKPKGSDSLPDEISLEQEKYGFYADWNARVKVMENRGFKASFRSTAKWSDIRAELDGGRPVIASALFNPSGQIICLTGYTELGFIANDPYGNPLKKYNDENGEKLLLTYDYLNKIGMEDGQTWAMFIERIKI
jgi:hypothetical protein